MAATEEVVTGVVLAVVEKVAAMVEAVTVVVQVGAVKAAAVTVVEATVVVEREVVTVVVELEAVAREVATDWPPTAYAPSDAPVPHVAQTLVGTKLSELGQRLHMCRQSAAQWRPIAVL